MGADDIPAYICKEYSDFLIVPLVHSFKLAIESNCFPENVKVGVRTPIFKK